MAAIFGKRKFFLKNGQSILLIYPVGQKFRLNRSISHGLGDFVQNVKIQNGRHFWKEQKILRIEKSILHIPCGPKILPKSLYVARFRRYKQF